MKTLLLLALTCTALADTALDVRPEKVPYRMRSGNPTKEQFFKEAKAANPAGTQAEWTATANARYAKWQRDAAAQVPPWVIVQPGWR